ncbi:hypothetical protein EV424DRAFT_1347219 [Suillus variegatus]|nr:hypothetical protein EV424DRAFT_1347219 [Suillus variegatus]
MSSAWFALPPEEGTRSTRKKNPIQHSSYQLQHAPKLNHYRRIQNYRASRPQNVSESEDDSLSSRKTNIADQPFYTHYNCMLHSGCTNMIVFTLCGVYTVGYCGYLCLISSRVRLIGDLYDNKRKAQDQIVTSTLVFGIGTLERLIAINGSVLSVWKNR